MARLRGLVLLTPLTELELANALELRVFRKEATRSQIRQAQAKLAEHITGGVFVLEAVSVMLQVGWFQFTKARSGTGRRIFLMAPLHHHFEKMGWYESQVVMRFYILCVLFAVVALATLKLR